MKKLEQKLSRKGFDYELIKRTEHVAIYSQYRDGIFMSNEIFIIPKYENREIAGVLIPAHEALPGDNAFGVTAWSNRNMDKCNIRFDELVKKMDKKYAA